MNKVFYVVGLACYFISIKMALDYNVPWYLLSMIGFSAFVVGVVSGIRLQKARNG